MCGGGMPDRLRIDTVYCSEICQRRSNIAYHRAKAPPKECPVCKLMFQPHRPEHICCSLACRDERTRQKKLARNRGVNFKPGHHVTTSG